MASLCSKLLKMPFITRWNLSRPLQSFLLKMTLYLINFFSATTNTAFTLPLHVVLPSHIHHSLITIHQYMCHATPMLLLLPHLRPLLNNVYRNLQKQIISCYFVGQARASTTKTIK